MHPVSMTRKVHLHLLHMGKVASDLCRSVSLHVKDAHVSQLCPCVGVCVCAANYLLLGINSRVKLELKLLFLKTKCQQTRLAEPSQAKIGNKSTTTTTTLNKQCRRCVGIKSQ